MCHSLKVFLRYQSFCQNKSQITTIWKTKADAASQSHFTGIQVPISDLISHWMYYMNLITIIWSHRRCNQLKLVKLVHTLSFTCEFRWHCRNDSALSLHTPLHVSYKLSSDAMHVSCNSVSSDAIKLHILFILCVEDNPTL